MSAIAERKVLIIENDEYFREFLATVLGERGLRVEIALNGLAGLDAVDRFAPDLVLLNVATPGIHGLAMMDALRRQRVAKPPRVVMVAAGFQNSLQSAQSAGAIDLLYQPVSEYALLQVVEEALDPQIDDRTLRELSRMRHALRVFDCVGCGAAMILLQQLAMTPLNAEQKRSLRVALRAAARERLAGGPVTRELALDRARRYRVVDPALVALALAEAL